LTSISLVIPVTGRGQLNERAIRILIADGSAAVRRYISAILLEAGQFEILEASRGDQVLPMPGEIDSAFWYLI
jgi:PleD family two-component response regulator